MTDRITITYGRVGNAKPMYAMSVGNQMVVGETVEILFHRYRIRVGLSDVIFNIAPDETPPFANLHECQPDEFSAYKWQTKSVYVLSRRKLRAWIMWPLKSTIRAACKIARNNPTGAVLERRDGKWEVVHIAEEGQS